MGQMMDSAVAEWVQKYFKNLLKDTYIQVVKTHNNILTYSCGTKLVIFEFSHFSGDDMKQWIYHCEIYFATDERLRRLKRSWMLILKEKSYNGTQLWCNLFSLTTYLFGWTKFKKVLTKWFEDVYDDLMVDLMRLRQGWLMIIKKNLRQWFLGCNFKKI